MVATHGGPAGDVFLHIARLFDRTGYRGRIRCDDVGRWPGCRTSTAATRIALLPSHRSYIDPVVLASVLQRAAIPPTYKLGGINVAFWPMGPMGRRAGLIFIRRSFRDDPVYKLALREYVGWLAEHRQNLEWYIEGGRTRTGKLRDPRLGLLAYLVDAVHDDRCDDFLLQPVSIVYDELLDVEEHARSATGAAKAPESLGRLISYARAQRTRYSRGDIHVVVRRSDLGARPPHPRARGRRPRRRHRGAAAAEARVRGRGPDQHGHAHHAAGADHDGLLWADRALSRRPAAGPARTLRDDVDDRAAPDHRDDRSRRAQTLLAGLASLQRHWVVTRYDGGREPVYLIQPEQRIAASYYRNGILHFFLIPAIVDLVGGRRPRTTTRCGCATS